MIESYYIGAYWSARKESAEECALRLTHFLTCLAKCDSTFTRWFETGNSREESLKNRIALDPQNLQKLLLAGSHRTDSGHEVIERLGYRISLWNGETVD